MNVLVDHFDIFVKGFWLTFQLCILAAVGSLAIGALVAVMRISPSPPMRWLGTGYVTVFRNVPLTVVFFFTVFGLPTIG
jgi:glutamate transport system permease protein